MNDKMTRNDRGQRGTDRDEGDKRKNMKRRRNEKGGHAVQQTGLHEMKQLK